MHAKQYLVDLTAAGLLLAETRQVAGVLLQSENSHDWIEQIVDKNLLGKKSAKTSLRYANVIRRRLSPLGNDFIAEVVTSTGQVYTQLVMLSAVLRTPAIPDFMRSVVAEAKRLYQTQLPPAVWTDLIGERARVVDGLGTFSDATIHKSGTNLIRILVEAGYLDSAKNRRLQPVYLLPETQQWLERLGRKDLVTTLECTL